MTGWMDASIRWQKQWLAMQQNALDAGATMVAAQDASRRAWEANLAAANAWARVWGMGSW